MDSERSSEVIAPCASGEGGAVGDDDSIVEVGWSVYCEAEELVEMSY